MGEIRLRDPQAFLFHRDRLKDLKTGINKVLDILQGVLCQETCTEKDKDPAKLAEYYECLQRVEVETWHRLKEEFIEKDRSFDAGDANEKEEKDISQIILQFVRSLDEIKNDLKQQLKVKTADTKSTESELQAKLAEERNGKMQLKLALHELEYKERERGDQPAVFLKERLKEKQDRIAELERSSVSQLWEKERNRIIETSTKREMELSKELHELKKTHERMKQRLVSKVKELEDKNKIMKIKSEISQKSSTDENGRKLEDLKRKLYMAERDLKKATVELLQQQKLIVGCIKGIRTDFGVIVNRSKDGQFLEQDIQKLNMILDAIYHGAIEGRLEFTKADLPLHYIALNEDLNCQPGNRKFGFRKNIDRHLSAITANVPSTTSKITKSPRRIRREAVTIKNSLTSPKKQTRRPLKTKLSVDSDKGNPQLINKLTGQLNIDVALECFPDLAEMEIREHREHFKRYDTNNDYTLDLSELIRAVQSTVGDYYTPQQIKDAMLEIDADGDETIDFYEYLMISSKLLEQSGKADIFRSNVIKQTNASVSKICSIQ